MSENKDRAWKVKRIRAPRPPAALHVLTRRIYGDSGYLRSVVRRRMRLCAKVSFGRAAAETGPGGGQAE